jgi:hypothetical protein
MVALLMTRITALLSFYDENPDWLERMALSLRMLPVDRLIAVDGAYELYPDPKRESHPSHREALHKACVEANITLSTFVPHKPWAGEVQKRNHMFEMAEQTGADWYFVIDSDEFVARTIWDVHERLEHSPFDVGAVTLKEPGHPRGTIIYPTHPKFFRAIPGLRAVQDHFTYTAPDGRKLWGDQSKHYLEPRLDLTGVVVEHHNQLRHEDRRKAAKAYYDLRDELGVEDLPAERPLLKDPA